MEILNSKKLMRDNTDYYYSMEELRIFINKGVIIPDLNSVKISKEIAFEKIESGSILNPFVRISGAQTEIQSGANVGLQGPVTIDNSWIGENTVIGNLGAVTLKDTVVGPGTILGAGVSEKTVFLGKENKVNDFTTGYGFRTRKGTVYEEDASSAQQTDTKMTILFPWSTLGSNINFCDILLGGGTGPEPRSFTEVGSGTIHFNFSIRGDKATASLLGDVCRGVFLDQPRLFIGGNNSLIGPIRADFGAMTAANVRIKDTIPKGLSLGNTMPDGCVAYDPRIFFKVIRIVKSQIDIIAELIALSSWYKQVRISCIAPDEGYKFIYESGLENIRVNLNERLEALQKFKLP